MNRVLRIERWVALSLLIHGPGGIGLCQESSPRRVALTGNATGDEGGMDLGCAYKAKRIAAERIPWDTAKAALARLRTEARDRAFAVVVDGKKMQWTRPTVTRATIISLFGLPGNAKLEVVEKDGRTGHSRTRRKSISHKGSSSSAFLETMRVGRTGHLEEFPGVPGLLRRTL